MAKFIKIVFVLCLLQLSPLLRANDSARETSLDYSANRACSDDCVEVGSWSFSVGLGLGARSNPLVDGDDIPLIVLPELSYYGKRFFLKNLELGFTLWENPNHQVNLLLTPSFDQMHFNRWDINNFTDSVGLSVSYSPSVGTNSPNNDDDSESDVKNVGSDGGGESPGTDSGLAAGGGGDVLAPDAKEDAKTPPDTTLDPVTDPSPPEAPATPTADRRYSLSKRKLAGLAGFEYMYSLPRFSLHFQSLFDVSRVHNGHEFRAAAIVPFEFEKNKWAVTLGLNYQSRKVFDYYYGIDAAEASSPEWGYSPNSSGLSQLIRIDWQRWVSRHWSWRAMAQYSRLAEEIQASPITTEGFVTSFFVGGVYHF